MKTTRKGFTLIELMIVVAIIGILAAIAIPKFADLINKSKEGATKGSLSSMRSALQVYYGDNEGWYPAYAATAGTVLNCLTTNSKYLSEVPVAKTPSTTASDSSTVLESLDPDKSTTNALDGAGGWYYYNNPSVNATWGNLLVNCTDEDIKNQEDTSSLVPWSSY